MAKDRVDAGRGRRADVVKKRSAVEDAASTSRSRVIAVVGIGALAYVASRPKERRDARSTRRHRRRRGRRATCSASPTRRCRSSSSPTSSARPAASSRRSTEPDIRKRLVDDRARCSYRFYRLPAAACTRTRGRRRTPRRAPTSRGSSGRCTTSCSTSRTSGTARRRAARSPSSGSYAKALGLDVDKWEACFDAQEVRAAHQGERADGDEARGAVRRRRS